MNNKDIKTKKKPLTLRNCAIVTNLTHFNIEGLKEKLEERTCITKYAYIIHDKDVYTEEDEQRDPKRIAGTLKAPHIHLHLSFDKPQQLKYVAKWFNVEENMVSTLKGRWNTVTRYLTHLNHPHKYQYEFNEVFCNFDYAKEIDINEVKSLSKVRELEIVTAITDGTIREYNITKHIGANDYIRYNRAIKTAFDYIHSKLEFENQERDMKVFYIQGESGTGKTTLAKIFAEKSGYDYFVSSSSNDLLDGYKGQDCIILDDLRASSLSLPDLLKLLDNHTNSSVKSRFKNKNLVYCKVIIITTIQTINDFFTSLEENEKEDITQLKRRCTTYIQLNKETYKALDYDVSKKDYNDSNVFYHNPVEDYILANRIEAQKGSNHFNDCMGSKVATSIF